LAVDRQITPLAAASESTGASRDRTVDNTFLALIANELVTNAIVYGTEPVTLTVSYEHGEVTVEVADGDPRLDSVRIRDVDVPRRGARPGGRGLRLVASIADEWGVRPERSGKTVWARKTYGA
jgi:anti-sigma regulatory factor (Ser/Thr protein kinase)